MTNFIKYEECFTMNVNQRSTSKYIEEWNQKYKTWPKTKQFLNSYEWKKRCPENSLATDIHKKESNSYISFLPNHGRKKKTAITIHFHNALAFKPPANAQYSPIYNEIKDLKINNSWLGFNRLYITVYDFAMSLNYLIWTYEYTHCYKLQ